ncbi:SPFH domain-containing protein [Aureispira anguillae]|uniref:SPFH domain-containing protein n=1 Tax=Aureispira anguillae TaxID=2864201 RepID=A0A915YIH6_9BACT|nr:SPFH domain-containing protein [Aureispira anguillae]BDS13813.1 SPFH domain-containing protein [Aureispira anguillae]
MSVFFIAMLIIFLFFFFSTVKVVQEKSAKIVQRLGSFNRILHPGINFCVPLLENIAGTVNLKVQQLDIHIETKTKDDVFVKLQVSVHVQIMKSKVREAFYELDDPYSQISSYIFDTVRAEVPKLELDDVFARKDDIATAVKTELSEHMEKYGYSIVQTLITDIDPDALVKESMNRINAAKRNKEAISEDAEGRKIAKIKDAEADKESKRLQGEGVADQRLAIIKGFADSVEDFSNTLNDVSPIEIMQFVLLTQHYDTIKEIGEKNSSIIVPYSPGNLQNLQQQLMEGNLMADEINRLSKERTKIPTSQKTFAQKEQSILDIDKNISDGL